MTSRYSSLFRVLLSHRNIAHQTHNMVFRPHTCTVAIAFFLSTETHAKRLLTIWKRSVWTTLKRLFAVLANQIIVSETFQAFRILANQISVRKTLSWKPCLVANVSSFASLVNQNPADSSYLRSFLFFFFFFFFSVLLNYNNYSSHGFAHVTFTILPYTGVPLSRLRFRNILPQWDNSNKYP